MPTCADVITTAMRRLRIVAAGESPTAPEAADCLELLQTLYKTALAGGLFGSLTRTLIDADYTANENELITSTVVAAITLPDTVTECGKERAPKDLAVVVVTGDPQQTFIYDLMVGDWVAIESLSLSSVAPLAGRFDIASMLCQTAAAEFGVDCPPSVERAAARARMAIATNRTAPTTDTVATYF